jgi:hypothetical protein
MYVSIYLCIYLTIYLSLIYNLRKRVPQHQQVLGKPPNRACKKKKPQQAAEQSAQAGNTRTRTQARDANSPDKSGEARQPKGEGRVTA